MPARTVVTWTAMLAAHGQHGDVDAAMAAFDAMPERNTVTDLVSWICLIASLSRNKLVDEAALALDRAPMLADSTLTAMLTVYAQSGHLRHAWQIFAAIPERDCVAWTAMIAAYAHFGHLDDSSSGALELLWMMELDGARPNAVTFSAALAACSHLGVVDLGRELFLSMASDRSIVPEQQHYCSIVDMFARAGRTREAEELLQCMPFQADDRSWTALLTACKNQGDIPGATRAAEFAMTDSQGGPYLLVSDLYKSILRS
ncbi:hypothetical protein SELMODRAFT_125193 [Selaginella moellendorffii]|uniref:Pentacotripeptide-repeat region of PRORP domain-containing protein n=1 Tax=Selaginella moellendorffii TaxID=88036 RepID=D8SUK6_SELML|nr:hypothetical protein SELMODRAFT_125193 [Selaginella moellendorffii]